MPRLPDPDDDPYDGMSLEDRLADEAMREHMDPRGFEEDYILGCQITERLEWAREADDWGDDDYEPTDEERYDDAVRKQDLLEAWSPLCPEANLAASGRFYFHNVEIPF